MIGCLLFFMAVNLAETQFPGYNTSFNTLSDLAGALPPIEPSATIFNSLSSYWNFGFSICLFDTEKWRLPTLFHQPNLIRHSYGGSRNIPWI